MAQIHNEKMRMPAVLREQDHEAWLNGSVMDAKAALTTPREEELRSRHVQITLQLLLLALLKLDFPREERLHWCPAMLIHTADGIEVGQGGKVGRVAREEDLGEFLEGLAIDKAGNIYVGLAFLGQIWKFAPDGTPSLFATLDVGQGAIIGLAVDDEGDLYVCNVTDVAGTHGIWKVDREGRATLFAALDPLSHPEATPLTPFPPFGSPPLEYGFPNGMAFDEQGNLFVGDSSLGLIWKITKTGKATVWLQDPLLNVKTPNGFGANDIEFDRGFMFISNLEQGSVVRVKKPQDDERPHPEVFVQDSSLVGADGLAFDVRHNLYMAIDIQNTLVRINPDGEITKLATHSNGLDYPASTSFGQSLGQRRVLYFTNAGLIFGTPSLQKIDIGIPGVPLP